jgi:PAS domain S-box-containing protein
MYASARQLLWLGLLASAALMTVAIFVAVWIGRALVRSVDTLVADTEVIGRGDVPAERSSGLAETDFVGIAMRKTALRMRERERENQKLNMALQRELEKVRQAEEASRRLSAIVESSDDAIVSKDLDGIVVSWNHGAERIFGYTAQEMVGRSITVLIPQDALNEETIILDRVRRGKRIDHFETMRRRKDGTLVPISLTVSPLRDHEGRVIGASKIARDVTQRLRADSQQHALDELVASVNRAEALPQIYQAALAAISHCQEADRAAILLFDAKGVMRFAASQGLSETYQRAVDGHSPWSIDEIDPRPVWIEDVVQVTLKPELRTALARENIRALVFLPLTYEKRLLGKFMLYYNAPHRFSADELRPVETIASQVAFAIERQKGAEALEALVHERTTSLRQVVAQMEEFSYSVSHDLRAPVRAMRGFAEIILQDHGTQLDERGRDLLARISRNSGRMDRLIQDLLTYSRVSRREIQLEPVSLDKLVREVVEEYPNMRPEHADIQVEGPLPDVIAHEPSLTQVISNLLSNAVKFVPPQSRPRIRVSYDRSAARARLWFVDNGLGIKPEHQKRLFGMFERLHPEKNYEGTGIGLAIVRKAVERMNGAVGVESDGISGSRFWFELPIASK